MGTVGDSFLGSGTPGQVGAGTQSGAPTNIFYSPAQSSSYFDTIQQNDAAKQIQIGSQMASILSLTPGGHTMAELLQAYEDLSQSQLSRLQGLLSNAGFYSTSGGGLSLGQHDNDSYNAFATALVSNVQNGTGDSLDQTIDNAITSGAGVAQQQQGTPAFGGGGVTPFSLTNPADVALTAHTIFQAALGRNPTPAELARITSALQSAQTSEAGQKNAAAEKQDEQQYQQKVSAYQAQQAGTAPAGAATAPGGAGTVPNGPFNDPSQWAVAFLQYLGDPVTTSNVATIVGLSNAVGLGLSGNNPLGITLAKPDSTQTGGGTMPTAQKYKTAADGMEAAAQTLIAHYPGLTSALAQGDAQTALTNKAVQAEVSSFTGKSGDITKQAQAASTKAAAAVKQYTPPGPPTPAVTHQGMRRLGDDEGEAQPIGQPTVSATNPQAPSLSSTQNLTPQQLQTQQGDLPAGSSFIPDTTAPVLAAPGADALAFQQATTGANQIPYEGYQYLQAFNAIMQMVHANTTQGG